MKILVLGASGMLGNAMFRVLSDCTAHSVVGTARSESARRHFADRLQPHLLTGIDVEHPDAIVRVFAVSNPTSLSTASGWSSKWPMQTTRSRPFLSTPCCPIGWHNSATLEAAA